MFCTFAAPAALAATLVFLAVAVVEGNALWYRAALYSMLVVVLLMETRVRLVYRQPRAWLFAAHIVAAVSFVVLCATLGFYMQTVVLAACAVFAYAGTVATGGVLFYRGLVHALRQTNDMRK
jgi:chromate transport protein ChrA